MVPFSSIVWRDDDVGAGTVGPRLARLREVDDLMRAYDAPHTVAVLAAGLYSTHPVVELIRERRMRVQLHGWTHDELTSEVAVSKLPAAVSLLEHLFGTRPDVIYPPWNITSIWLDQMARSLGLVVSYKKTSLPAFIRTKSCETGVLNFNYWNSDDREALKKALAIAYEKH